MAEISAKCSIVLSMLPNDTVVENVASTLLNNSQRDGTIFTHVSCSTVSPTTARTLATSYQEAKHQFVSAPVFARPDGIAKKQAYWLVSGETNGRQVATEYLSKLGQVWLGCKRKYDC